MSQSAFILTPGSQLKVQAGTANGRLTYCEYSYEEITSALARLGRSSRRGKTPEAKASRTVGLLVRGINTGMWVTGAEVDTNECWSKLVSLVRSVNDPNLLTLNARCMIQTLLIKERSMTAQETAYKHALFLAFNRGN